MIDLEPPQRFYQLPALMRWLGRLYDLLNGYQRIEEAGSVTFATAGTAAVTFATAQPDTSYYLILSGDTAETFNWSSKATSGFTANSSNASSTATVDWAIVR